MRAVVDIRSLFTIVPEEQRCRWKGVVSKPTIDVSGMYSGTGKITN